MQMKGLRESVSAVLGVVRREMEEVDAGRSVLGGG